MPYMFSHWEVGRQATVVIANLLNCAPAFPDSLSSPFSAVGGGRGGRLLLGGGGPRKERKELSDGGGGRLGLLPGLREFGLREMFCSDVLFLLSSSPFSVGAGGGGSGTFVVVVVVVVVVVAVVVLGVVVVLLKRT